MEADVAVPTGPLLPKILLVVLTGLLCLLAFGPSAWRASTLGDAVKRGGVTNWLFWVGTVSLLLVLSIVHMDDPMGDGFSTVSLIYLQYAALLWMVGGVREHELRRSLRALWLAYVAITLPLYLSGHWSGLNVVFLGVGMLAVGSVLIRYQRRMHSDTN